MSEHPEEILQSIKQKIKKVFQEREELRRELTRMAAERESLQAKLQDLESMVEKKDSEIETLKLAKAYSSGDGVDREARSKINEMVKEIDRCIALLNN